MKIRTRLALWYAAVLAVIVVAIAGFLLWRLRADLVAGLDAALATRAEQTHRALEDPAEPNEDLDVEDIATADVRGISAEGSVTQVLSPDGELLGQAGDEIRRALLSADEIRALAEPETSIHGDYRVLALRLERSGAVLAVGSSMQAVDDATRRLLLLLAVAVPTGIALSALGGYVLAGRALRPVDRMTRTAAAIGGDDTDARLDVPDVDDEVGRLGRTLNAMLDRLHSAIAEQRRFTADASHELRTPLAIMQTEIDVALRSPQTPAGSRPVLESLAEELARTRRIVESLFTLARADEDNLVAPSAPVDMRDVAKNVHDRLRPTADAKGSRLSLDTGAEPAIVLGDEIRLDQLITNLVDNALSYTPDGGKIDVRVAASNGVVTTHVSDDGPGIPPADLPRIFERFHRVDKVRGRKTGGAGLGLAICRSIARAHGGDVGVESTDGAGCVFTVRLPARALDL